MKHASIHKVIYESITDILNNPSVLSGSISKEEAITTINFITDKMSQEVRQQI